MTLGDILQAKGSAIYSIGPEASLREVACSLVEHRVGALLVLPADHHGRRDEVLGIITERDLLRICAAGTGSLEKLRVAEVMSAQLVTGAPTDSVEDTMGLMTRERKRHLPVVSEGRVAGMISIGDLVKWQHDHLAVENRFMKDYIQS